MSVKLQVRIDDKYNLVPLDAEKLRRVTEAGQEITISYDTERQRSTPQLAKYWAEIHELCGGMSEAALALLLNNLVEQIAITGKLPDEFFHSAIKAMRGVDSIALTVPTKEVSDFFDFAFTYIERLKRAFNG